MLDTIAYNLFIPACKPRHEWKLSSADENSAIKLMKGFKQSLKRTIINFPKSPCQNAVRQLSWYGGCQLISKWFSACMSDS